METREKPKMVSPAGEGDVYQTVERRVSAFSRLLPSLAFYPRLVNIVWRSGALAKRGGYGDYEWYSSSLDVLRALECVGVRVEVSGLEHVRELGSACVFVGNHMSVLETFVLPGVVRAYLPVTFIVKQSLLDYPVFRFVMRSRNPIAVGRTNPREDFAAVMKGGKERLANGISIIVFPQTTRTPIFSPKDFNSIGVKLAQRSGVPVVPIALVTDAWGNGRLLKDFGKIDVSRKVHIAFGQPIAIEDHGSQAHATVIEFIQGKLEAWKEGAGGGEPRTGKDRLSVGVRRS